MARYLFNADKSKFPLDSYLNVRTITWESITGTQSGDVLHTVIRKGESGGGDWTDIPNDETPIAIAGYSMGNTTAFKQCLCGIALLTASAIEVAVRNDSAVTWSASFTMTIYVLTKKQDV